MESFIFLTICLFTNVLISMKSIHIMQLNSYNVDQQIIWYKKNIKEYIFNIILLFLLLIDFIILYPNVNYSLNFKYGLRITRVTIYCNFLFLIITFVLIPICLIIIFFKNFPKTQKKKLVWTKRIIRLFSLMIFFFVVSFIFCIINKDYSLVISCVFITAISPLICFFSFLVMTPIENSIRKKFVKEASKILKSNKNIYTIGITGSFGKTSVKYFLSTILQSEHNICFTKGSFNTPMGATLTIKNELKSYDEIFICEMGARRIGDIKEICEIVEPKAGIITEVGEQHLDTFKNIDNVLKTKFELADFVLKENIDCPIYNKYKKILLVNGDNEIIKKYISDKYIDYLNENQKQIWTFGKNDDNDFYAKITYIDSYGTKFKFYDKKNNKEYEFKTSLLGEHNVLNLCSSIAMATLLGIDNENIKFSVERILPVEHRLEIKRINQNQIIIDDAYNANIKGVSYALDTLKYFTNYTKILITPGIVELGDKQYEFNKQFIKEATKICDYIIVVSKANKEAMLSGLKESNYNENNYFYFDSFNEAYIYANTNIQEEKKLILIENDLTDNY